MKFLIALLLTALLGYAAPLYSPWWTFAITSFVVALAIHQRPVKAFLSGFLALFLLWGIHAFWLDHANHQILSRKIALLLGTGHSGMLLVLITACVGAIISGMAALSGSFARRS